MTYKKCLINFIKDEISSTRIVWDRDQSDYLFITQRNNDGSLKVLYRYNQKLGGRICSNMWDIMEKFFPWDRSTLSNFYIHNEIEEFVKTLL